jgi:hypothetical protein
MIPALSLDASDDTDSRSPEFPASTLIHFVRQNLETLSEMSDSALQTYICECAERFCAAQREYEKHGNLADAGDRDRWWQAEAEALRVRGSRTRGLAA